MILKGPLSDGRSADITGIHQLNSFNPSSTNLFRTGAVVTLEPSTGIFLRSENQLTPKVLIIDDDAAFGKLVELILKSLNLSVYLAYSGEEGLKKAYKIHPDLAILDINLPGMDGFEVCSRLREFSSFPIMMLTARVHENDVLHGFNVGANDYLKKPFSKVEFEARVRALLRRASHQSIDETPEITSYTDSVLEIDLVTKIVRVMGKVIDLSPKEYELLACLVREQGLILSRRELVREVWGDLCVNDPAESSLYIYYLRKKIKDCQFGHQYIRTHWGRGYWFEPRSVKFIESDESN
jgi:DNA-binding response OmpR family regulator